MSCLPVAKMWFVLSLIGFIIAGWANSLTAEDDLPLEKAIRELSPNVFSGDAQQQAKQAVALDLRLRLQQANDASRRQWEEIQSLKQWKAFSNQRVAALRDSLGEWPERPEKIDKRVTGVVEGDGFVVENIAYESRPGWWVTANLYRPEKAKSAKPKGMPGIIISHSHHRPKEHGELQDMGMTWARAGCLVLVPDHLGHGERRQHGFTSSDDYARDFAVSRQDYYFRYDNSIQLYLVGDSLMQWMAWDLMRGVDVLLDEDGIDPQKIILMGAVAGGGDPCAVTAALDERIACAVPFNFGGPQPETRYPLPEDAETWFNYAGSGSWESTRNLAYSAGRQSRFLPWEIVGSIAPRRLIFAHEFNWHRERDPVWKSLERIYELHDARDHLAYAHGRGELKGRPPEATHCTHIGKFHRQKIHEALANWFDIQAEEFSDNRAASDLHVLSSPRAKNFQSRELHAILADRADKALSRMREEHQSLSATERKQHLREELQHLLGNVAATKISSVETSDAREASDPDEASSFTVQRIALGGDIDRKIPLLLLIPAKGKDFPVVIGLAQGGKSAFLNQRSRDIAKLIDKGVAICLPDVCNTGERGHRGRGRYSPSTSRAATALMVGDPLIAQQIRDVRAVMNYLRSSKQIDAKRIALWGESFAELNDADTNFRVPRRIDGRPEDVEPLGGMLALLAALYEDDVAAVHIHRGLAEYAGAFESPFVYVPLDSVIPGLLQHADIPDITAALAPTPVQMSGMVDAFNRQLTSDQTAAVFALARQGDTEDDNYRLEIAEGDISPAGWLGQQFSVKDSK